MTDMGDITKEAKEAFVPAKKYDIKYAYRVLILLAILAAFVMYVDIMLTPSLPTIGEQYGVDSATTSLIISLYLVFGTAIMPVIGKLGDIYGKKRIIVYVLIAYSVMVGITSFTSNFTALLVSRTFQGIGLSIFPLAFSMVREEFPKDLIPRAQGLLAGMFGGGIALGLPLGAYIANSYGWQANYHIALPFIVALTILIFFVARESIYKNLKAKLDYIGAIWLGTALSMIVFGVSEGANWGWTSLLVLFLMLGGALLIVPLIFIEKNRAQPILNTKLLSKKNVLIANIIAIMSSISMYLAFIAISYRLETPAPGGFGFDILTTGIYLVPLAIAMLAVGYPIGVLISRYGVKRFLFLGSVVAVAGFFLLASSTQAIQIAEYLTIAAAGLGIMMVSAQNLLVLSVDPHEMGLATSLNSVFRNLGASLGVPIAGSLISTFVVVISGVAFPTAAAFEYCYFIAAVGFIAVFFISFLADEVIKRTDGMRLTNPEKTPKN